MQEEHSKMWKDERHGDQHHLSCDNPCCSAHLFSLVVLTL